MVISKRPAGLLHCLSSRAMAKLLGLLKLSFSIEECRENYQASLESFITSCIKCKDRNSRVRLLEDLMGSDVSSYQLSLDEYNGDRILLDLVEQALSFAINHGLPGREICFFLSFYISALDLLAGNSEATSLAITIQQLQDAIIPSYSGHMSPSSLQASMSFITQSILQHFHLYQFLLTQPQATDLTSVVMAVETPDREPPSLEEGVEEEVWLKMKKVEELKAEFEKKIQEMEKIREQAVLQADANLGEVYSTQLADFADGPVKLSYQQVVDALVGAHVDSSMVTLAHSLLQQNMELEFRVEQLEVMVAPRKGPEGRKQSSPIKSSGNSPKNN